jgi:hypothetical protein
MAIPTLTVTKGVTTISNVQTCTLTKGRIKISDDLRPGTATVTGRRPDLLPSLEIGDLITVELDVPSLGPYAVEFDYRVADLKIDYGIISSLDTWTLDLEDAFAYLGRAVVTRTWTSGTAVSTVASNICSDVGITLVVDATSKSTASAQTVTDGSALDVFQTLVNTEQALVQSQGAEIFWYSRGWQSTITYWELNDTGGQPYDALTFGGLADNYADKVVVYPRGSSAVATGTGIFSYNLDSYSFDSGQAQQLGLYVKGVFDVQTSTPLTVSVLLNTQTNGNALAALNVGSGIKLVFRGTTYYALVEGFTVTSDPENTRITYNLSSTDFYSFLTLDDLVLGKLDNNKLGF